MKDFFHFAGLGWKKSDGGSRWVFWV